MTITAKYSSYFAQSGDIMQHKNQTKKYDKKHYLMLNNKL